MIINRPPQLAASHFSSIATTSLISQSLSFTPAAIVGAVERKGNVVTRALGSVSKQDLQAFVRDAVSTKVSLLATDEHPGYGDLGE